MKKENKKENKTIKKEYNFLFLVEEGGTLKTNLPCKTIYKEKLYCTREKANEYQKELKNKFPDNSITYFSI